MSIKRDDISIRLLKGSENDHQWREVIENILIIKDLHQCLDGMEKDGGKIAKTKAYLMLAVEPSIQCHIKNESTPNELWKKLSAMYEDAGISR